MPSRQPHQALQIERKYDDYVSVWGQSFGAAVYYVCPVCTGLGLDWVPCAGGTYAASSATPAPFSPRVIEAVTKFLEEEAK